jgi:hypothetical protein
MCLRRANLLGRRSNISANGIRVPLHRHEPTLMWSKLVFLAAFALSTTAADKTTGEILSDPVWRDLGLILHLRGGAVAVAEGAKVDADAVIAGVMKMPGNMRSSMQKDVEQARLRNSTRSPDQSCAARLGTGSKCRPRRSWWPRWSSEQGVRPSLSLSS